MFNKIAIIVMSIFIALFSANNSESIDNNYFGRYYNLYHGYDENIRYFVRGGMNND